MNDEQTAIVSIRLNEVQSVLNALATSWAPLAREFERIRAEKVLALITENNEQTRGAVKQIDDLLHLPNNLRQELLNLANSLPKPGE